MDINAILTLRILGFLWEDWCWTILDIVYFFVMGFNLKNQPWTKMDDFWLFAGLPVNLILNPAMGLWLSTGMWSVWAVFRSMQFHYRDRVNSIR